MNSDIFPIFFTDLYQMANTYMKDYEDIIRAVKKVRLNVYGYSRHIFLNGTIGELIACVHVIAIF